MKVFSVYLNSNPVAGLQQISLNNARLATFRPDAPLDTIAIDGSISAVEGRSTYRYLIFRNQ